MIAFVPNCKAPKENPNKYNYVVYVTWGLTVTLGLFVVASLVIGLLELTGGISAS